MWTSGRLVLIAPGHRAATPHTIRASIRTAALRAGLAPPASRPGPRPNTHLTYPIFDAAEAPASPSLLVPAVWDALLRDYPGDLGGHLVGVIEHGARIGYSGPLRGTGRIAGKNLPLTEEEWAAVDKEVKRRVDDGTFRAPSLLVLVTSPLGAVPKPPDALGRLRWRVIHHLSWPRSARRPSVNDGIASDDVTLRYETLLPLFDAIAEARGAGEELELWKVDFAEAFRHISVCESDAHLNGCSWEGSTYIDTTLPFGLRSSPFLFNLFSEAFHWILGSLGLPRTWHYLDDFYGLVRKGTGAAVTAFVVWLCGEMGYKVSPGKVEHGTRLDILGVSVDVAQGVASVSDKRRKAISDAIALILQSHSASRTQLQSLAGSLIFVSRVCVTGRAFVRRIFDAARMDNTPSYEVRTLSKDCLSELRWWRRLMRDWDGARLLLTPVLSSALHIFTDASGSKGVGGHFGYPDSCVDAFSRRYPRSHAGKDIQFKETLAVLHACYLWSRYWVGRHVIFHCDNQAVCAAISNGSIKSPTTQDLLRQIYTLSSTHHFTFSPVWLASKENWLADALSRSSTSHLSPRIRSFLSRDQPRLARSAPIAPNGFIYSIPDQQI